MDFFLCVWKTYAKTLIENFILTTNYCAKFLPISSKEDGSHDLLIM